MPVDVSTVKMVYNNFSVKSNFLDISQKFRYTTGYQTKSCHPAEFVQKPCFSTNSKCNSQNNIAKHFKVQSIRKIGKRNKMKIKVGPTKCSADDEPRSTGAYNVHTRAITPKAWWINHTWVLQTNTSGIDIKGYILVIWNFSILFPFSTIIKSFIVQDYIFH